jgi:hypothetical protein
MPEHEINNLLTQIQDKSLRLTLSFGIGIHHAGLKERDRHIVEELFVNQKIQILVATVNIHFKYIFFNSYFYLSFIVNISMGCEFSSTSCYY